jgi:hypothetical protein
MRDQRRVEQVQGVTVGVQFSGDAYREGLLAPAVADVRPGEERYAEVAESLSQDVLYQFALAAAGERAADDRGDAV